VHLTTFALVAGVSGLGLLLGYQRMAAVQLPVLVCAAIIGTWLFSVQHRGKTTRWVRHEAWDPTSAALQSSTYLRLPAILQWFTGNIGFHHVHHMSPRAELPASGVPRVDRHSLRCSAAVLLGGAAGLALRSVG
jgi:omega-6 fatty acid desaturase (delta-12 desaturase)